MKLNTYGIYDLPTKRAVEQLQRKITSMEAEIQSARSLINSIKANGTGGGVMPDLSEYAKTSEVEELLVPYAKSVDVESELESYALTANVESALAGKVDVVDGKGLSTNDYTNEEKDKLTIQSEWVANEQGFGSTFFYRIGDVVVMNCSANYSSDSGTVFKMTGASQIKFCSLPSFAIPKTSSSVSNCCYFYGTSLNGWGNANMIINSNQVMLINLRTPTGSITTTESFRIIYATCTYLGG